MSYKLFSLSFSHKTLLNMTNDAICLQNLHDCIILVVREIQILLLLEKEKRNGRKKHYTTSYCFAVIPTCWLEFEEQQAHESSFSLQGNELVGKQPARPSFLSYTGLWPTASYLHFAVV